MAIREETTNITATELPRDQKIVSVIGLEAIDITYFLVELYKRLTDTLLVIDNSENGTLYAIYEKSDMDGVTELDNITICRNMSYNREVLESFDRVIILHGMQVDVQLIKSSDEALICSDCERGTLSRIRFIIDKLGIERATVILQNMINKGLSESYLLQFLNIETESVYVSELTESGYLAHIMLTHNKKVALSKFSKKEKENIIRVIVQFSGLPEKKVRKLIG